MFKPKKSSRHLLVAVLSLFLAVMVGVPASGGAVRWSVSADTSETYILVFASDDATGTVFAGTGNNGLVLRCTVPACPVGSWSTVLDTPDTFVHSLAIDTAHRVVYAGTGSTSSAPAGGKIYRCDLATLCDAPADWSLVYDSNTQTYIRTLMFDPVTGAMYAGTSESGWILRCSTTPVTPTAVPCSQPSDWARVFDTNEARIYVLGRDPVTGALYAGTQSQAALVYRCDVSTLCDSQADWRLAFDSPESHIRSFAFDSANGVMYVGTGDTNGRLYRCDLATLCDQNSNFAVSFDTPESFIQSMAYDPSAGMVYMGTNPHGIIYSCVAATRCLNSTFWSVSNDTPDQMIHGMTYGSGAVWAGTYPNGVIWRGN